MKRSRKKRGRPRAFNSEDEFVMAVENYIYDCEHVSKRFPNISGFCVFANINRDTFYAQKAYYSDTYKRVFCIFEDAILNDRNSSARMKILYLMRYTDFCHEKYIEELVSVSSVYNFELLSTEELRILKYLTAKIETPNITGK